MDSSKIFAMEGFILGDKHIIIIQSTARQDGFIGFTYTKGCCTTNFTRHITIPPLIYSDGHAFIIHNTAGLFSPNQTSLTIILGNIDINITSARQIGFIGFTRAKGHGTL